VLIGALLFGYFLTITQTPQKLTEFLTSLGIGRYGVLALIMLMYLVFGLFDGCDGHDHFDCAHYFSGHRATWV
jgi:TRAP-type C4-dicarboxylate transport system permease large subunit